MLQETLGVSSAAVAAAARRYQLATKVASTSSALGSLLYCSPVGWLRMSFVSPLDNTVARAAPKAADVVVSEMCDSSPRILIPTRAPQHHQPVSWPGSDGIASYASPPEKLRSAMKDDTRDQRQKKSERTVTTSILEPKWCTLVFKKRRRAI